MLARPDGHLCPHALELLHLRFRHQHVVPESPLYGWDWEWDRSMGWECDYKECTDAEEAARKAEAAQKREADRASGAVQMNGRELFKHEPWVFDNNIY
uniref:Uncharacterized protein n=1 Tax=Oryza nivara TaxID=4536 RepID=A0A0E0GNF4_ORYNI